MNWIGLETIGWVLVGVAVGAAIGRLVAVRRSRLERDRIEQDAAKRIQQVKGEAKADACSLRRARSRLQELEATVPDLEASLARRAQRVARLQAQVIDRESTIDSLRSRLYGARISTSLLEEELELLQHQFRTVDSPDTDNSRSSTSSLTISLGDGLEIETAPTESKSIGGI